MNAEKKKKIEKKKKSHDALKKIRHVCWNLGQSVRHRSNAICARNAVEEGWGGAERGEGGGVGAGRAGEARRISFGRCPAPFDMSY